MEFEIPEDMCDRAGGIASLHSAASGVCGGRLPELPSVPAIGRATGDQRTGGTGIYGDADAGTNRRCGGMEDVRVADGDCL